MTRERVIVTGGGGFLGSFVMEQLKRTTWCGEAIAVSSREYDLRRKDQVERLYRQHRPSLVIHLAGRVGGIGANLAFPADFFYDNALMGIHVLHEAVRHGVPKVVTVGSVCSYPEYLSVPYKEEGMWQGSPIASNGPYGIAKRLLMTQGDAERAQYGLTAIHLILTNLYGPRDHFDPELSHVIPALVRKFVEAAQTDQPFVTLWGSGSAVREFLFVEDAARAIVLAAETYDDARPVNIGSGTVASIREVAECTAATAGYRGTIRWDRSRPDGQRERRVDATRMRELLHFTPAVDLHEGLRRTVEWYREQQGTLVRDARRQAVTA